jgi:signal transduction histidine kinase
VNGIDGQTVERGAEGTPRRDADVTKTAVTAGGPAARPPAGSSRRDVLSLALGLILGPCVLFAAGLVFVSLLRRIGAPLAYGTLTDLLLVVLGLLVPAGVVAGVVVLVRGRRAAPAPASGWAGPSRPAAAGGAQPGASDRRPRWAMLLAAAGIAAASVLFFFAVGALGLSYGVLGDLVMIGAAAVAALGLVVAAVVAVLAFVSGRAMSLRARTFWVIVVVVLIPSACLAAFGVWAYVRSWERAEVLYTDRAFYEARELSTEIGDLGSGPVRFTPGQRARLSEAIVSAYGWQGHLEGAYWATMDALREQSVLPAWALRSLRDKGLAIGDQRGPTLPNASSIVAWRVGEQDVRYYTDQWVQRPAYAVPTPFDRLLPLGLLGATLIIILGLIGAWILSRSVVRPVRRLAEASGRLAEGEAGVTVKPEGPRELRDLAVSFNDMNAKLSKAQETEQAFLLSVSHELKTPLTSIRGYAEGIGDGTVKPDDGAAVIGAESSRLERLVGDLLESGRLRKSAFSVRRESVDLVAVAEDVARRYEATARDAGLTLLVSTEAGGAAVADHDRVLQVVSNLVENAIRCTPVPGTVTITTAPAAISVADTGRGLTGDDLPRAFERFYLYTRYGSDRPVGTGLGLAIVKELTEAMGGTVSVSSAVGVGTAFTVTLPAEGVEPGDRADSAEPPAASAPPKDDVS